MRACLAIGLSCAAIIGVGLAPLPGVGVVVPERAAAATGEYPSAARVRAARGYAQKRVGSVSFAVLGAGGLRGLNGGRAYGSASVTKALLLAGFLQQRKRSGISDAERALLGPMIRVSDNDAADAIYDRVGDGGLRRVAHHAGMRHFSVTGHWGGAQITADDMARFFFALERRFPERHRDYAMRLLADIVGGQRWGIPRGARGWQVNFKGGWRPDDGGHLAHQAALLRRDGERIGLAVMTTQQPSLGYATDTIAGITRRLTHPPPHGR